MQHFNLWHSKPSSNTWEKEEENVWKRLSNSYNILISISGVNTYLTIINVSLESYGKYQLNITNDIDEFIQTYFFIAEGIVIFYQIYSDKECQILTAAKLFWR